MISTIVFITLLIFVSSTIKRIDDSIELDSIPEFVQLTNSPISKVLLSAISLKMRETTNQSAGFNKIMALMSELIHDNRKQLQQIRRINERVQGQCLVSNSKLKNRERSFSNLLRYFKSRGSLALSEKSEAINMQNSRKQQAADYAAAKARFSLNYSNRSKKLEGRIKELNAALTAVNSALKAVSDWAPKNATAFIEEKVKQSVDAFQKTVEYPITYDHEMIQLAASDDKIKKRLFEWLTMLKSSIVSGLSLAQSTKTETADSHNALDAQLTQIIKLENADVSKLTGGISNWSILIKNYNDNEKIYAALKIQTTNILKANKEWCNVETANYNQNKQSMEDQLKVFVDLRDWLRKNYSKVRDWIRKKYNQPTTK